MSGVGTRANVARSVLAWRGSVRPVTRAVVNFPVTGEPLHTRCISIDLYQAEEDAARFAGRVIDQRKSGFIVMAGDFQSAGIIHNMELDGEFSASSRVLERVKGRQPAVAYEPTRETGGECCRDPIQRIEALAGERFDERFAKALMHAYGGPLGCSHLLTLFRAVAALVPRALDREAAAGFGPARRDVGEQFFTRSLFVDGFRKRDGAIQVSIRIADVHTGPYRDLKAPMDRLNRYDELRIVADVDVAAFSISGLVAGERSRSPATWETADWVDRSADVASFKGQSLGSGMAAASFERLGGREDCQLLLEAMLHFAPGFIQVIAGLGGDRPAGAGGGFGGMAGANHFGGQANACYMWRTESPLMQIRTRSLADGVPDP